MTSPVSVVVVGGGVLLASPALYAGFVAGTLPMGAAVVRLAVAVLVVWLGIAALEALVAGTSPEPVEADGGDVGAQEPESTPSGV